MIGKCKIFCQINLKHPHLIFIRTEIFDVLSFSVTQNKKEEENILISPFKVFRVLLSEVINILERDLHSKKTHTKQKRAEIQNVKIWENFWGIHFDIRIFFCCFLFHKFMSWRNLFRFLFACLLTENQVNAKDAFDPLQFLSDWFNYPHQRLWQCTWFWLLEFGILQSTDFFLRRSKLHVSGVIHKGGPDLRGWEVCGSFLWGHNPT